MAAPDPPLDPPGVRDGSHGLRHGPHSSGSVTGRSPHSGVLVLPRTETPEARTRIASSESQETTWSTRNRLPAEVGWPAYIDARSLARKGTPAKGPSAGRAASRRASFSMSRTTALMTGFKASMRASAISSSSGAVTSPARTSAAIPVASWARYSSCVMVAGPDPAPGARHPARRRGHVPGPRAWRASSDVRAGIRRRAARG